MRFDLLVILLPVLLRWNLYSASSHQHGGGIVSPNLLTIEKLQSFDIRCVLTDIDGTLINSNHNPSLRTLKSIRSVQKFGLPFFIATGRSRKSMADVTGPDLISLFGGDVSKISGVFNQGLEVFGKDGVLIHERFLDDDVIQKAVHFSRTHEVGIIALASDRILCDEQTRHTLKLLDYGEPLPEVYSQGIVNLSTLSKIRTNKLILLEEESRLQELRISVEKLLEGVATVTTSVPGMLEILPYGASKGEGVKKLLEHYSLDRNHTIAFGDGENDVEMLQLVGLGVAVDNAREKLKRVAKALTLSNNDDGVAHVLDMIVSNMKLVSDIEGNS